MTNEELLQDTNSLLRRLFELEEQNRLEAEKSRIEFEKLMEKTREEQDAGINERLVEVGVADSASMGSMDSWQQRSTEATRAAQQNIDEARAMDQEYKDALLAELRKQSDLLRQIAEKLGL